MTDAVPRPGDEERQTAGDEAYELDLEAPADLEEAVEEAVSALDHPDEGQRNQDAGASQDAGAAVDPADALAQSEARYLRLRADFENFRRRSERERENVRRFALQAPMRSFLEAIDNLERAMAAGGTVEDLKAGLDVTLRGLAKKLSSFGIEPIETVGKPFDPAVHEAVSRRDDPQVEVPTVVTEMQRGYRLHDRLLRPAMVVVAVPSAGESSGESSGQSSD